MMAAGQSKRRWMSARRYTFGAGVCLLTVVALRAGLQWYWAVAGLCVAALIVLGKRRIFRPGVTRNSDEIVCRYIPWYEGNVYFLNVMLPLMGVASVAAGYAPGNPAWLRFSGGALLAVTPLMTYAAARMWRRCYLRISPSALAVRLTTSGDTGSEIRREAIESIEPKMVPNAVSGRSLQVEITYRPADSSRESTNSVVLGLQLSVQPVNLLNALVAWKDAPYADPNELLDAIERTLRGCSTEGI